MGKPTGGLLYMSETNAPSSFSSLIMTLSPEVQQKGFSPCKSQNSRNTYTVMALLWPA